MSDEHDDCNGMAGRLYEHAAGLWFVGGLRWIVR